MFGSLSGTKLGVWVAHGEGKFEFPYEEKEYNIIAKYNYDGYPANPNGSPWSVAGVCSKDGRHLAMMPHPNVRSSLGSAVITPPTVRRTTRSLHGLRRS